MHYQLSISKSDMKNDKKIFKDCFLFIMILFVLCGCAKKKEDVTYTKLSDFNGKKIGVATGTIQAQMVEKEIPDAEILYYNGATDLFNALIQGKVDAIADSDILARYRGADIEGMTFCEEYLSDPVEVGAIFSKTEKGNYIRAQFNEYLAEIIKDGTIKEIDEIWYGKDNEKKVVKDPSSLPDINGTLKLATDASIPPGSYISNNQVVGIDIDIATRFCEAYGYGLEIVSVNFSSLVETVNTSKCDFGIGCIAITAERAESVNFSDSMYTGSSVVVYLKDTGKESVSFAQYLRDSFNKTFIVEDRWKLFVEGVGTTLLITVLSLLFGTALGFVVYLLNRHDDVIINKITDISLYLIQGTPVVVLLMIIYYIIFGNVNISGIAVSVICFTIIYACSVFGMLSNAINTIDKGQYEAAYSLGYSDNKAFFSVILPQALPFFMPVYKAEIKTLIKATAIVGYVAVEDLTKMGDMVRSITFDAFFPLIVVAVMYYVMAAVLTAIVNRIDIYFDPRKRSEEDIIKKYEIR